MHNARFSRHERVGRNAYMLPNLESTKAIQFYMKVSQPQSYMFLGLVHCCYTVDYPIRDNFTVHLNNILHGIPGSSKRSLSK